MRRTILPVVGKSLNLGWSPDDFSPLILNSLFLSFIAFDFNYTWVVLFLHEFNNNDPGGSMWWYLRWGGKVPGLELWECFLLEALLFNKNDPLGRRCGDIYLVVDTFWAAYFWHGEEPGRRRAL